MNAKLEDEYKKLNQMTIDQQPKIPEESDNPNTKLRVSKSASENGGRKEGKVTNH